MVRYVRNLLNFICPCLCIGLASKSLAMEMNQLPPISGLMRPVQFPILRSNAQSESLQARFKEVTLTVENGCQKLTAQLTRVGEELDPKSKWLCLWPRVVEELDQVGTQLQTRSTSQRKRLALSLAARGIPYSLTDGINSRALTFDALYGRYLIALRMINQMWPELARSLGSREHGFHDELMGPWLSTGGPWSFVHATCSLGVGVYNQDILIRMAKVIEEIDRHYPRLSSASTLPPGSNFKTYLVQVRNFLDPMSLVLANQNVKDPQFADPYIDELLQGNLFNVQTRYFFYAPNMSDPDGLFRQYSAYLATVAEDSARRVTWYSRPSGTNDCHDYIDVQRTARQMSLAWSNSIPPCREGETRYEQVAELENSVGILQVQLLQIRAALVDFYAGSGQTPGDILSLREDALSLKEITESIRFFRSKMKGYFGFQSELERTPRSADWSALFIGDFLDTVDGL